MKSNIPQQAKPTATILIWGPLCDIYQQRRRSVSMIVKNCMWSIHPDISTTPPPEGHHENKNKLIHNAYILKRKINMFSYSRD